MTSSDATATAQDAFASIEQKMTGELTHDLACLSDMARNWYNSDQDGHEEVAEECWQRAMGIIAKMADETGRTPFPQKSYGEIMEAMDAIDQCARRGDRQGVRATSEDLISWIEGMTGSGALRDGDEYVYRSFSNPMEGITWRIQSREERQIVPCPFMFDSVYLAHSMAEREDGHDEAATSDLHKALHWNPANASLWFELAEVYRSLGRMDEYGQCVYSAYPYVLNAAGLARYHRSCGILFKADGNLELAAAHFHLSARLDPGNAAPSWVELGDILERYGKNYMQMEPERAAAVLRENSESPTADQASIAGIMGLLHQALSLGDYPTALMSAASIHDLTGDEHMQDIMLAIVNVMNGNGKIVVNHG